jgi:hypothetical protein
MKEYRNKLGQLHRTDGPAFKCKDGHKEWYINDKLQRGDGPAIEWSSGVKEWYINGLRHRTDGPAMEFSDGSKLWYLNNIKYSEEQFHQELIKLKLNRLKEL